MSFPVALIAGVVPMLLYPILLYLLDRYEKEPLHLIAGVFLWGFVPAAILSIIGELVMGFPLLLLDSSGVLSDVVTTVVFAPVMEEFFKGLAVLLVFLIWRNEFDDVFDGIIYGGLVGFGFAAIENVLYFMSGDFTLFVLRAIVFGLNHAFYTSLTGIGFGAARNTRKPFLRVLAPLAGLLAAMAVHGLHNLTSTLAGGAPGILCLTIAADWGGILFVFVVMLFAIRRQRQWIIDNLRDEVGLGTLSELQYEIASSPLRRFSARLGVLFSAGPAAFFRAGRYFNTLTELAFKKHEYSRRGEQGAPMKLINSLREKAALASSEQTALR